MPRDFRAVGRVLIQQLLAARRLRCCDYAAASHWQGAGLTEAMVANPAALAVGPSRVDLAHCDRCTADALLLVLGGGGIPPRESAARVHRIGEGDPKPVLRAPRTTAELPNYSCTGAGEDNGIAKMWNRREISVSYFYDQSHYLLPHP